MRESRLNAWAPRRASTAEDSKSDDPLPSRAFSAARRHEYVNGSYQFSVARIQPREGRLSIMAHESSAHSVFERRPLSRVTVYLRNRPLSEAMEGSQYDVRNDVALARILPFAMGFSEAENSGFGARALMVQFPPMYREKPSYFDYRWLAQAELVIVRFDLVADRRAASRHADFPIRADNATTFALTLHRFGAQAPAPTHCLTSRPHAPTHTSHSVLPRRHVRGSVRARTLLG